MRCVCASMNPGMSVASPRSMMRAPAGTATDDAAPAATMRSPLMTTTPFAMAGAPLPFFVAYLDPPSAFNLSYAVNTIAMPLIGGTGSWLGPVVGAVLVGGLQEYLRVTISSAVNVLVAGVLMVAFVIAAPQGIVGLFQKRKR